MPLVRAEPQTTVLTKRRGEEPSSYQGHSPNRTEQLTARRSRRLTSGGEAEAEIQERKKVTFSYAVNFFSLTLAFGMLTRRDNGDSY